MANLKTLNPSSSLLNGIEIYEPIDYSKLTLLMNSTLLKQYKSTDRQPYENEITHLKKYMKNYNKKMKCVKVKYVRGDIIEYGRVNPEFSLGLHCLKKQIRHTIVNGLIDIDIVNCHPVILLNICKKNDYPCDKLTHYVRHRGDILQQIQDRHKVSRDDAKTLVIILIYLGSYDNWIEEQKCQGDKLDFLVEFHDEMSILAQVIRNVNPDLTQRLSSIKDKHNNNSIMSYYLQTIECNILETIVMYCRKKRIIKKTYVLSNDGLMIPIDNYKPSLLTDFKNLIKQTFDIELDFETKAMDKGFTDEQLRTSVEKDTLVFMDKTFNRVEFEDGVLTDRDAVEKVLSVYDNFVCVGKTIFGFDYNTGLWVDADIVLRNIVMDMDEYLKIKTWSEKDGDFVTGNKGYANTNKKLIEMKKYFYEYVCSKQKYVDDNFFNRNSSSSEGCLLYKNGILKTNNETKTLHFVEGFDKNIVFTTRIDVDYIVPNTETSLCDYEDIAELKTIFFDIFGEQQDYFIEFIATAIFGKKLKNLAFVIGDSNAGKSTLINTIIKSFTSDIIGSFDIRNFLTTKNTDNDASKNRWILLQKNKRLLVSSESVHGRLDCEYIKQVASGGKDAITGRLHCGNETSFIPDFMLLTMLNSMPSFDTVDDALKNRLIIFKLEKKYVDIVTNPDTELKKMSEEELYEYKHNPNYIDAFRWLIIDAYQNYLNRGCKFAINSKLQTYLNEVIENNVDDGSCDKLDFMMDIFEITGDENDRMRSSNVIEILQENKVLNYLSRNNRERKYMFDKFCNIVDKKCYIKTCKIDGQVIRCYIGLKLKHTHIEEVQGVI